MSYSVAVARGNISGTQFHAIGRNGDIDNAREDLWESGGTYVFPASGIQMQVVSSSANDDGSPAGTGARTVDIHYLDANYEPVEETVTLNGVTPVTTTATNILRIQDFHVKTIGSGLVAAGDISLQAVGGGVTYSTIPAGNNRCRQAIWTVPADKTAFVTSMWGGNSSASAHWCEWMLRATCDWDGEYLAGIFNHKTGFVVQDSGLFVSCEPPIKLPAKTDVKITVISDGGTANVVAAGGFRGWYE